MNDLQPGLVKINQAEFLAALITCETFAKFCEGKYTLLALDNYSAKGWLDRARCPAHPLDRCAQGWHLYLLDRSMKIQTKWIPSEKNVFADMFSRKFFAKSQLVHRVAGYRFRKVRPLWSNVVKFL